MAPLPHSSAVPKDDDFIFTLSDDDAEALHDDAEEKVYTGSSDEQPSKKRKRESRLAKSQKKRKQEDKDQPDSDFDGDLNPDFELTLENDAGDLADGFDGWDLDERLKTDLSKGSLDDIIARRVKAREAEAAALGSEEEDDVEAQVNGFGDEDEELLADDAFGMGGGGGDASDEESGQDQEGQDLNGHMDWKTQEDEDDQEDDDDDDDVAEPVAHPDDELSDPGEEEDRETPAQIARKKAFFAPEEVASKAKEAPNGAESFQNLSLSRPIMRGLTAIGFTKPTPIQKKTVPVALLGKDVVGGAVTGSGKTGAFLIPILERLLYRPKSVPTTRVGILMPTRELAVQCFNVATKLASFTDITVALTVGGLSLREQEQTLRKRPDIVIATPGRFIDHMRNSSSFAVENIEILVLDEADRMLEDGFADELNEILTTIPKSRQTMLFSATMTEDVDKLIRVGLKQPVRLLVDAKRQTVSGLVQEFVKMKTSSGPIDEDKRLAYLLHICQKLYMAKTIVFFPTKVGAHRAKILLALNGISAAELHGSMSQEQRLNAISQFRDGKCTHLLATDLASRGLDIPRVETVINFTVPPVTETYLHRVGRTARAGRQGVSCTIFSPAKNKVEPGPSKKVKSKTSERTFLRPILRLAKSQSAIIRSRSFATDIIDDLTTRVHNLSEEIDAVLVEEKEEKLLQQTERDLTKSENIIKYEDEIASRPKRTWFQNEREKSASSKLGLNQRIGAAEPQANGVKRPKRKLSNKEKKHLQDRDERRENKGGGWKKGKEERMGKGVLQQAKDRRKQAKSAVQAKAGGGATGKPKPKVRGSK